MSTSNNLRRSAVGKLKTSSSRRIHTRPSTTRHAELATSSPTEPPSQPEFAPDQLDLLTQSIIDRARAVRAKLPEQSLLSTDSLDQKNLWLSSEEEENLKLSWPNQLETMIKLKRLLNPYNPSEETYKRRKKEVHDTIHEIKRILWSRFGRKYDVLPFGSTVYLSFGVPPPGGDIDLVILDPDRPVGFTKENKGKVSSIYNVRRLAQAITERGKGKFVVTQVIPFASVPIIRFKTSGSSGVDLSFDMQVNERLGLYNSLLLREYCSILPHGVMRDMLRLIVKIWAKPRGFNSPSPEPKKKGVREKIPNHGTTFSSYALTLMCISYLQGKSYLPNLQEDLKPMSKDVEDGIFYSKGIRYDARFHSRSNRTVVPTPVGSYFLTSPHDVNTKAGARDMLREHLLGWFKYWGYEFDYDRSIIDIKAPGGSDMLADNRRRHKHHVIMLRDPFIRDKNITKGIGGKALDDFRAACRQVYESGLAELWNGVDLYPSLTEERLRSGQTVERDAIDKTEEDLPWKTNEVPHSPL